MVADSGDVAAQAEKPFGAQGSTKAARYFLSDFEHAQDLLRMIVGEGDAEVVEEGEHRLLVTLHAVQEVDSLALFWAAGAGGGGSWRGWIGGAALSKQGIVAPQPRGDLGLRKPATAPFLKFMQNFVKFC